MDLLVKNVLALDYAKQFQGDVYIKDGKIHAIGKALKEDCEVVDGEGLVLLPSFIDLHSHFRDPGLTYKEDMNSGSLAAVKGGYTAVNLMANTRPVCSSMETVEYVLEKSKQVGFLDVHQTVSITRNFDGQDTSHLDEIGYPVRFISDDGKGVLKDAVMLEAMEKAKLKGITVISHAENEDITPISSRLSENLMTVRDITLAEYTGCRLHMAHVSTREAIDAIIDAKRHGCRITCEVTPHHIALTGDTEYKVNPSLRENTDVECLIKAIRMGFVDTISTDHAPHSAEDKQKGAPGIPGIETAFSVCYTKLVREDHITLNKLSELMSKNPGRIMGLNKGEITPGYDGDLILVDVDKKYVVDTRNFKSKGRNTPFEGNELYGVIKMTIKAGRVVYREERL